MTSERVYVKAKDFELGLGGPGWAAGANWSAASRRAPGMRSGAFLPGNKRLGAPVAPAGILLYSVRLLPINT